MTAQTPASTSGASGASGGGHPVIFLPGIIMPAALRYRALLEALGDGVRAIAKDLEVYAGDAPPPDYSIETEIAGISRAADEAGFERFHLYAHSGGGACALAYTAAHPERVLSLSLDEPASDFSPESKAQMRQEMAEIQNLPPDQQIGAFISMQLAPGVEPPPRPDGPVPEWMAKRPAGIEALTSAIQSHEIDDAALRRFPRPVYYSYGSLSSLHWDEIRARLAAKFPNFTADRYDGLHHFNTSHAAEPERVARVLLAMWATVGEEAT